MRPKHYKGRCIKRKLQKCKGVVKLYDKVQDAFANILDFDPEIIEIECNVPLDDIEDGRYTTDFLCTKSDGDKIVRECIHAVQ